MVKGTEVAFAVGNYDHTRDLIIDPSFLYSTYLGAGNEDDGYAIAVDSTGAAYVTGQTSSPGFPKQNPLPAPNNALQGTTDAFVTKFSADGTTLAYSTYLGGTGVDSANAIAIDASKQVYVTGSTDSSDFPAAGNPRRTRCGLMLSSPRRAAVGLLVFTPPMEFGALNDTSLWRGSDHGKIWGSSNFIQRFLSTANATLQGLFGNRHYPTTLACEARPRDRNALFGDYSG